MNRNLIASIFCLLQLAAFSQTTQHVKNKIDRYTVERYDVLSGHPEIKNGPYALYVYGRLVQSGFYLDGKKDSLWKFFSYNGQLQESGFYKSDLKQGYWTERAGDARGSYLNGQRIGEWTFYAGPATRIQVYNYDTRLLTWYEPAMFPEASRKDRVLPDPSADSMDVILDHPAMYIGGNAELYKKIQMYVRYPLKEKENNTMGTVYVAFEIDSNGHAHHYRIQKGVSEGLDKEALRVIQLLGEDNWIPAAYMGKPIETTFIQPVKFVLQ